MGVNF